MTIKMLTKKRRAQTAILLTLLLAAPCGAAKCYAQAAGFASSRSEQAATAESGPRRLLSALNPFHSEPAQSEPTANLVSPTISQPVVTNAAAQPPAPRRQTAPAQPQVQPATPRPAAQTPAQTPTKVASVPRTSVAGATPAATRTSRPSVRPGITPGAGSSAAVTKKSSTGGVASLLLDELEEDIGDRADATPSLKVGSASRAESPEPAKTVRKSLRSAPFPSSLELLDDEDDDSDDSDDTTDDGPATVFSSEEDDDLEDLEPAGMTEPSDDDAPAVVVSADDEEEEELDEPEPEPVAPAAPAEPKTRKPAARKPAPVETLPPVAEPEPEPAQSASVAPATPVAPAEESLAQIDSKLNGALASVDANPSSPSALSTSRAPNVEVDTIGPKKLTVGQESTYRIIARNAGAETARRLVVTTDLPNSVSGVKAKAEIGEAVFTSNADRSGTTRCVWNAGDLAPGEERTLEISLRPMKRAAFELLSRFEFERASARADVEVQEPVLEALIEGRDSIEWGVEDKYRLRLRNTGNGDAEDVALKVSTGENVATQKIGVIRAGEEKTVEMSIKTAAEDSFTIKAAATGAYGLSASAEKMIEILRGQLDIVVETPDLQFVDGEFEATIRVRNLGSATLQNVDVVAQIPEGAELVFCSNQARRNPEKRRVYWVAPFIRPNEETTFSATCRVKEPGEVAFDVVGVDQNGMVAQGRGLVNVESIASLAMRVVAPKEPVAVGKTCWFELIIENNGTRDARDINSGVFLGAGVKPLEVEGNRGYVYPDDSKALFKKIDCLKAGETAVFRVKAEALAPGNQKIQAMVQSVPEDVSLLSEETTYCYARRTVEGREPARGTETMTADRSGNGKLRR